MATINKIIDNPTVEMVIDYLTVQKFRLQHVIYLDPKLPLIFKGNKSDFFQVLKEEQFQPQDRLSFATIYYCTRSVVITQPNREYSQ